MMNHLERFRILVNGNFVDRFPMGEWVVRGIETIVYIPE